MLGTWALWGRMGQSGNAPKIVPSPRSVWERPENRTWEFLQGRLENRTWEVLPGILNRHPGPVLLARPASGNARKIVPGSFFRES